MVKFKYRRIRHGVFEVRTTEGEVLGRIVLVIRPDAQGWSIGTMQLYRRCEEAAEALSAQSIPTRAA